MVTSEARIKANQANSQHSSGPKTPDGKEQSRRNALKHGMTGAGIVLPEGDAAEVARRSASFAREMDAQGDIGHALARRAALNSVRMERAADQQTAALSERVRRVEADFVPPEGISDDEADKLRNEACRIAMFDPSKEATLARKYEATAERTFFRCLKELQRMARVARAGSPVLDIETAQRMLGSFSVGEMTDEEFDRLYAELDLPPLPERRNPDLRPASRGGIDLPITIGRRG